MPNSWAHEMASGQRALSHGDSAGRRASMRRWARAPSTLGALNGIEQLLPSSLVLSARLESCLRVRIASREK